MPDKFLEHCVHWANFGVLIATQVSRKNAQSDLRVPLSSREAPIQFFFIKAVRAVRNLLCYWVQIHVKDKVVTVALQKVSEVAHVSVTMVDKNTTTLLKE